MGRFEDEYNKLNYQQKQAVDNIHGPMLVVAGPGTGKTQLLSMRVANILRLTDTADSNILCLTFTNKASINMKERLLKLTDNSAKNVMVKTFHSFSAEIMNLYPEHFWNGARLTTAPETVQTEIIQSILGSLPLNDPLALKFSGKFTAGNDVKTGLRLVKEAGLTPDKLKALIEANLAYIDIIESNLIDILSKPLSFKKLPELKEKISHLPEQGISLTLAPLTSLTLVLKNSLEFAMQQDSKIKKTINTSKWKQNLIQSRDGRKGMHKERERNNWWLSLANVYELYRQQLHNRSFYDYSDMIVEVISVLEQNSALRSDVQERFQYVLIDEFQDSNSAQMRLAHLVADHDLNMGKPNLMVVGDDDQSIYKFNGAELANMLLFQKSYPDTKLVVLTENFRSSQDIIDTSSKVIEQASDRLTLRDPSIDKKLVAKNPPNEASYLIHKSYTNQAEQFYDVTKLITNQYNRGERSIAVLARNNDSLRRIASNLLAKNIPISFQEQNNILDHQITASVYNIAEAILSIVNGDSDNLNYYLSQILCHPMWEIDPYELWVLASSNRYKDWLSAMKNTSEKHQFHTIQAWLLWLASKVPYEPLPVLIEYIIGLRPSQSITSPLCKWYTNNKNIDSDYLHGLSALKSLLSLVDEFSILTIGSLQDFVNFIKTAKETGQIIADESTLISDDTTVNLLTVHKAKGLEFDTVYIIDAIDNNWRPRTATRRSPSNLPLQPAFDDMDDYLRLMYVAMTRARQNIIITSYKHDEKGQDLLASPLIENIFVEEFIKTNDTAEKIKVVEQSLTWPSLSISQEKIALKPRLENFQLSATAFLSFLDVTNGGPASFKERHFLSLPSIQTPYMAFGTAMHNSLELAQILVNKDSFVLDKILKHYQHSLIQQNLPKVDYNRFLTHGIELLNKLFASDSFWLPKNSLPEQSITDVRVGQARLYGKLDRVDIENDSIRIVDYKTGKPLSSLHTHNQTKAVKAWRHRTQLTYYCLLAKYSNRFSKYTTQTGKLIYLEASNVNELTREFNPGTTETTRTEQLIQIVWQKIMALDFPNVDHYEQSYSGICKFEDDLLNGLQN